MSSSIDYHLRELEIAKDPSHPSHSLPPPMPDGSAVLDVGCGVGQTLAAGSFGRGSRLSGVDCDAEAIEHGRRVHPELDLRLAPAEALPYEDGSFDLVYSRVALPYTRVPRAVAEMHRVLRPGGRLWLTLHPASMERRRIATAVRTGRLREVIDRMYVVVNSVSLHLFGRVGPRPWSGSYESVQTTLGMMRVLGRAGFEDARVASTTPFLVTARRRR